jgi:hypothetical protein
MKHTDMTPEELDSTFRQMVPTARKMYRFAVEHGCKTPVAWADLEERDGLPVLRVCEWDLSKGAHDAEEWTVVETCPAGHFPILFTVDVSWFTMDGDRYVVHAPLDEDGDTIIVKEIPLMGEGSPARTLAIAEGNAPFSLTPDELPGKLRLLTVDEDDDEGEGEEKPCPYRNSTCGAPAKTTSACSSTSGGSRRRRWGINHIHRKTSVKPRQILPAGSLV